jgi:hypothetical protein
MITSVMAAGVAFTGSAAASPGDASDFKGFVAANPADATANTANGNASTHTITANITSTAGAGADLSSAGDTAGGIIIEYGDAGNIDTSGLTDADVDVDLISADGSTVSTVSLETTDANNFGNDEAVAGGGDAVSSSGQILILVGNGDSNLDGSQSVGDQVRVTISGIDHNGLSDTAVDVGLTSQNLGIDQDISSAEEVANLNLGIGGPIDYNGEETYYSLQAALNAVSSNGEFVNVSADQGELDETYTQPTALGSTTGLSAVSLDNNVVIVGGDNTQIEYPDVGAAAITDNDGEEITVDNLNISGNGFIADPGRILIDVGNAGTDLTVQDSTFDTFDTDVIETEGVNSVSVSNSDFDGDTGDNYNGIQVVDTGGNVDIDGNTFANISAGTGIDVQDMAGGHFANITSNTVNIDAGTGIIVDASNNNAQGVINDNTVEGSANGGVGLRVEANGGETSTIDVDGDVINNTGTGIDGTNNGLGDFLNVTSVDLTNIGTTGIDVGQTTTLTVDGVTIDGTSSAEGINLNNIDLSAEITGTTINDTTRGIDAADAATLTVSDTTIDNTNTNNQAIRITDPSD